MAFSTSFSLPPSLSTSRSTMHLKPHPKLVKSELGLDPGGVQGPAQRGSLRVSQQAARLRAEWGVRQACITRGVNGAPSNNNHGNVGGVGSGGRYPLSVISTNTLRRSNSVNNNYNSNVNNNGGSRRLSHQGEFYTTWAHKAKITSSPITTTSSSTPSTFTSSLLLLSPSTPTGSENDSSLSLYQSGGEEGEGPLDIWAVIKPGNTKEKIAIFASASERTNSNNGNDCSNGSLNGNLNNRSGSIGGDSAPETEGSSPPAVAVLSRAVSMKVKGIWEGECSTAKRRRRSGNSHHHHHHNHHLLKDQRTKEPQQQGLKPAEATPAQEALSQPPRVPEGEVTGCESPRVAEVGEEGGKIVSVVEMVAFLEQRANEQQQQQLYSKPVISLQRSSTSITLSKASGGSVPAPLVADQPREGSMGGEEEGESVRVSDMVAKLESECLKRRSIGGGDLSRNNSLRRTVGRVLLAGADAFSVSAQPPSPSNSPSSSPSPLPEVQSQSRLEKALSVSSDESPASPTDKPRNECASLVSAPSPAPASPDVVASCEALIQAREAVERSVEAGGKCLGLRQTKSSSYSAGEPEQESTPAESLQTQTQCHSQSCVHLKLKSPSESKPQLLPNQPSTDSPSQAEEKEPLPGMLFFSHQLFQPSVSESHTLSHTHTPQPSSHPHTSMYSSPPQPATDSELYLTSNLEAVDSPPLLTLPESPSHIEISENKREKTDIKDDRGEGEVKLEEEEGGASRESSIVPFPLLRMVSHEFLEMRFKIQLLLEPQQYLAFLPDHVIVKIFSLLPTQSLAALKCTCHYFKFIIEHYGVRPADSRWVCDARYRDDPCKQCKKRYGRGDVSLCRWHHKPYCQAMPYGPGYWMCCHDSHKDTPGCNVGLHDNRWVPVFHSINMPIYKRNGDSEEEA